MMLLNLRNKIETGGDSLACVLRLLLVISIFLPFALPLQSAELDSAKAGHLSISVQNTDIAEVFEMLSREGKVNILLGQGVDGELSVNLYDVRLDEAVRTISAAAGFAVEFVDNSYFIMTQEEAGKDMAGGMTSLKTFKAQYTDVNAIAEILNKHLSRYGQITTLPDRNLIVVEEIPAFMERIEELLSQVDRRPQQILIEAKILEVTLDDSETFGVDWSKLFSSHLGSDDSGGSGAFGTQGLSAVGSPGFFFSFVSPNITLALDALSDKGRVRTLSTPKLLALEHEEAEVVIGDRTGYRVTTTINQVTTESVAFLESGVILKVIPFVDQNGQIMMDVHPEVSNATISNGIPSLTTTEVTTQFLANSGQTIFIAGLMKNSYGTRNSGVPILSDIPLLGRAFKNSERLATRTETVVLITPRIVESGVRQFMSDEATRLDKIDKRLQDRVKEIELKLDPDVSFFPDTEALDVKEPFTQNEVLESGQELSPMEDTNAIDENLSLEMLMSEEQVLQAQLSFDNNSCVGMNTNFMSLAGRC